MPFESSLIPKLEEISDPSIRYLGIINEQGRIQKIKSDLTLPKEKEDMLAMQIRLIHSMAGDLNDELGLVDNIVTLRGNSKFISIPISKEVITLVTDRKTPHHNIVKKIKKKISNFELQREPLVIQG